MRRFSAFLATSFVARKPLLYWSKLTFSHYFRFVIWDEIPTREAAQKVAQNPSHKSLSIKKTPADQSPVNKSERMAEKIAIDLAIPMRTFSVVSHH
jgi:hypothetical protein